MKISRQIAYPGSDIMVMENAIAGANGKWGSLKISIFLKTVMVGEYLRNYPTLGMETFYPFKTASGQTYALYSAHYSTLRVLKISDLGIEDWCGQEVGSSSFCPGEMYVPQYVLDEHGEATADNHFSEYSEFAEYASDTKAQIRYADFGFMAGCAWGDDAYFNLKWVDLSGVDDKQLTVSEHYGLLELPNNLTLKQCITFAGSLDRVNIAAIQQHRTRR